MELTSTKLCISLLNIIMAISSIAALDQMRGVNRAGTEYACVQNHGIFEGDVDDKAIDAMLSWKINVVRIPLNSDCWLGINGFNQQYTGDNYQNEIHEFVKRLRHKRLKVILDLHWTDGKYNGIETATCQKPMPGKNALAFWTSVAKKYGKDQDVIFDLFNEPFPDKIMQDKNAAWKCWENGGKDCINFEYEVVGMKDLVKAVRDAGGQNWLMLGGLTWANDVSQWLQHRPEDRLKRLAVSWHSYDENACNDEGCWKRTVEPLIQHNPVIVGEIGDHHCVHKYIDRLMPWLDSKRISYLGWTWNAGWDCGTGPTLISNFDGTPTEFGKGFKAHLCGK